MRKLVGEPRLSEPGNFLTDGSCGARRIRPSRNFRNLTDEPRRPAGSCGAPRNRISSNFPLAKFPPRGPGPSKNGVAEWCGSLFAEIVETHQERGAEHRFLESALTDPTMRKLVGEPRLSEPGNFLTDGSCGARRIRPSRNFRNLTDEPRRTASSSTCPPRATTETRPRSGNAN